jgi:glycosyltransferase involved in cell wall biosynthesis
MCKISVILASYNHEKYVAEAIQSVLDQSYQDFEIIITDDGSSDSTVAEITKFKDPRINIFCFEHNLGACVALGNCLDHARGQYISVQNSDDIYIHDKLEKQALFLDEHPDIAAVFGHAILVDENGSPFKDKRQSPENIFDQKNRSRHEWLNYFFSKGNCLCHPSILIRRSCYKSIGYYDPRYAQLPDFDFWIKLCMNYDIHITPEPVIKFRIRDNQANASARSVTTLKRQAWEHRQIMNNFLKIDTFPMLYEIFPYAEKEYGHIEDPVLIPFIIAMIALNKIKNTRASVSFAIDTIGNLMADPIIAKKLNDSMGFRHIDFINITGRYDPFNIDKIDRLKEKTKHPIKHLINKLFHSPQPIKTF